MGLVLQENNFTWSKTTESSYDKKFIGVNQNLPIWQGENGINPYLFNGWILELVDL